MMPEANLGFNTSLKGTDGWTVKIHLDNPNTKGTINSISFGRSSVVVINLVTLLLWQRKMFPTPEGRGSFHQRINYIILYYVFYNYINKIY